MLVYKQVCKQINKIDRWDNFFTEVNQPTNQPTDTSRALKVSQNNNNC